jgi:hypothetical protein
MALHLYVNAETQCTKGIKHGNRGDAFLHLVYTPPPAPLDFEEMGCPALGIWVGFLKQPALPGEAPQKKIFKKIKFINKKSQINQK